MTEEEAIAWLREQGRVKMPLTQISQRPYQRVIRRVGAWKKAKLIRQYRRSIIAHTEPSQPIETTQETASVDTETFRLNSATTTITISTEQICALAASISDGTATPSDRRLADRLLVAFAGQYPRDESITLIVGTVADDIMEEDEP
jgi:adenine C2-methylase RlmN of 23S rRNA A2503 and tRNA A37